MSDCISRTQFEQLSNELFQYILSFLDAHHLYNSFVNLNARIDIILCSLHNVTFPQSYKTDEIEKNAVQYFASNVELLCSHSSKDFWQCYIMNGSKSKS